MPQRMYQRIDSGAEIKFWADPNQYVAADMPGQIQTLKDVLALDDSVKLWIMQNAIGGFPTLDDFNDYIEGQLWKLQDINDYFGYQAEADTLWNYKYQWMTPEAVESVSGEDPTDPAVNSIDDDNATRWHYSASGPHTIVYRLRDYPKKVTGIRIRLYSNTLPEQLTDVDIRVAKALSQIDNAENLMASGVSFAVEAQWNEVIFATPKTNGRYIKLEINSTNHVSDHVRIRDIDAKVETIDYSI